MKVDPVYLRDHYASLSDEALEEIDRGDLVEVAQKIYDEELGRRKAAQRADLSYAGDEEIESPPNDADAETASWLPDAAVVFSAAAFPGQPVASAAVDAQNALMAAGVPCVLEVFQYEDDDSGSTSSPPTHEWRVMVPGELNLLASSLLERDIFNADFEETWRAHLTGMSDQQVRAMNPRTVFCGLFDKIDRVTRVYQEELTRRELK